MAKIAFVIALVFVPAVVAAQTDPELIAEATLALPDQLKDGATVSSLTTRSRRFVCDGWPIVPRTVVTPFATNRNNTESMTS